MNPLLDAIEKRIEAQLMPKIKKDYSKIVVAGMKVALEKGTDGLLYSLRNSRDPVHDAAVGAVGLVLLMRRQSKGTMPLQAMVPAMLTLMLKALDFVDRSKLAAVDNAAVVRATHLATDTLFKAFGITHQMMTTAATRVHKITQDPVRLEKLKQTSGLSKTPTLMSSQAPPAQAAAPPAAQSRPLLGGG